MHNTYGATIKDKYYKAVFVSTENRRWFKPIMLAHKTMVFK